MLGWPPVPNASPGSSIRLMAPGSGGMCQVGTTHKRSVMRVGANCSLDLVIQSPSATVPSSYAGTGKPVASQACRSNCSGLSCAWHKAVSLRNGHEAISAGSSNRRVSAAGPACASSQVTENAPASSSASEKQSASDASSSKTSTVNVVTPPALYFAVSRLFCWASFCSR